MHFTTLNIKIADEQSKSICTIELVEVAQKRIIKQKSWLIRPIPLYISPLCHKINHLRLLDFMDCPTLPEIWPEIVSYLQGQVIFFHKAIGQLSILLKALDSYQLPYPECVIGCSLMMSKKLYPSFPNHQLSTLDELLHFIPSTEHHVSTALQVALLILHLGKTLTCSNTDDLLNTLGIKNHALDATKPLEHNLPTFNEVFNLEPLNPQALQVSSAHTPSTSTSSFESYSFRDKVVCLTGPLESMTRVDAVKKLYALGATYSSSVTSKTNVILTNVKNPESLPLDSLTSKLHRAMLLKASGQPIDIISEEVFLSAIKTLN